MKREHNRIPRIKKVQNSKRIRNSALYGHMRYLFIRIHGIDISGYPLFIKTIDYGKSRYKILLTRHYQMVKNRANGRAFYQGRHKQNTGKSSRAAMREKQQWLSTAIEALQTNAHEVPPNT